MLLIESKDQRNTWNDWLKTVVVGFSCISKHLLPCLSEELEARKGKMNRNATGERVWVVIRCPEIHSSWLLRLVLEPGKTKTG